MKKYFDVQGMSCNHCRAAVEKALNSIDGVRAIVTLDPAVAQVEFTGGELPLEKLQDAVSREGEYVLLEQGTVVSRG